MRTIFIFFCLYLLVQAKPSSSTQPTSNSQSPSGASSSPPTLQGRPKNQPAANAQSSTPPIAPARPNFRPPVISKDSLVAQNGFSYFILRSEWGPSYCAVNTCKNFPANAVSDFWNVHGLWPSGGEKDLENCPGDEFNPALTRNFQENLNKYWTSFLNETESFHAHEWKKHGTCSGLSQANYFSTSLRLARKYDVYSALSRYGIAPGGKYTCQEIARAITTAYRVTNFHLIAVKGKIFGISLCVGRGLLLQNCPDARICTGRVEYPAFPAA